MDPRDVHRGDRPGSRGRSGSRGQPRRPGINPDAETWQTRQGCGWGSRPSGYPRTRGSSRARLFHTEGRGAFQDLALDPPVPPPGGTARRFSWPPRTRSQTGPDPRSCGFPSLTQPVAEVGLADVQLMGNRAIGRPDYRTEATGSALDSGENCRRCCPIGPSSARHSLAGRVSTTRGEPRECRGHAGNA
jgi:hypothetical protein